MEVADNLEEEGRKPVLGGEKKFDLELLPAEKGRADLGARGQVSMEDLGIEEEGLDTSALMLELGDLTPVLYPAGDEAAEDGALRHGMHAPINSRIAAGGQ